MTRKNENGWEDDPLTSRRNEEKLRSRLRAAIEDSELTQRKIQKATEDLDYRILQQTLNEFLVGKTKRLRMGAVDTLAKVLDVPSTWLCGDEDGLRYATWQRGTDSRDFPYNTPPRAHLAQDRFIHNCLRAFRRDLRRVHGGDGAKSLYTRWEYSFAGAFQALIDIEDGRAEYLDCNEGWPELTHEEFDRLTLDRVDEMKIFLRPWLEGKQGLDYEALAERTGVIAGFPEADW